jgi:hemolysin III
MVCLASISGDAWRIVSFSIYGASLVLLYLASTLYHSLSATRASNVFRILDHSCIYILIAGTYTPFTLISLRGQVGWTLFATVWVLAITGVVFKSVFMGRLKILSVVIYIVMGWIIVFALKPLLSALSTAGFVWLLIGGLSYTLGIIAFSLNRLKFNHAIWHLFVLGGSVCHFFALFFYVLPVPN